MQISIIPPQHLNARIALPSSKSISNRALIIYALSGNKEMPLNISDCDDTRAIQRALKDMPDVIDIGPAGSAMRFLTAYLSVMPGEHTLTGTERMCHRPISGLVDALRYLGADIEYLGQEGFPPLRIGGQKLDGGHVEMPGNVSSQYISALLMIGPAMRNGLELKLTDGISSRPYIDLTLWVMQEFGAKAEWSDVDVLTVRPEPYQQKSYLIENDWTAASYWYEILALMDSTENTIEFGGLMDGSKQGDSVVKYLFSMLGVKTAFHGDRLRQVPTGVTLTRHMRTLPRLDYDFINSPDLAQTFVTACAGMGIPFHFTGLGSLRIKETDRIEAMKHEMMKLGFVIRDKKDTELYWDGERCEPTMEPIETYEDHRMAMAFAPLSVKFPGLCINHAEVVTKSYPHFWQEMEKAGFNLTIID